MGFKARGLPFCAWDASQNQTRLSIPAFKVEKTTSDVESIWSGTITLVKNKIFDLSVIELLLLLEKEGMEIICIEPHRDKEHPDLLRPSVNLICSTRRRGHTRDVWQQTASS